MLTSAVFPDTMRVCRPLCSPLHVTGNSAEHVCHVVCCASHWSEKPSTNEHIIHEKLAPWGTLPVLDTLLYFVPPQVIKYSMDGEQLLTLGLRGKPGHDTKRFCKPTAVRLCPRPPFHSTAASMPDHSRSTAGHNQRSSNSICDLRGVGPVCRWLSPTTEMSSLRTATATHASCTLPPTAASCSRSPCLG